MRTTLKIMFLLYFFLRLNQRYGLWERWAKQKERIKINKIKELSFLKNCRLNSVDYTVQIKVSHI